MLEVGSRKKLWFDIILEVEKSKVGKSRSWGLTRSMKLLGEVRKDWAYNTYIYSMVTIALVSALANSSIVKSISAGAPINSVFTQLE